MALINVAINFGYECFCFVIYFSKFFFVKTFLPKFIFLNFFPKFFVWNFFWLKFFFQIFFLNFFLKFIFHNFFLKICFKIFFSKCFSKIFFQFFCNCFFFEGFTLDASPLTEAKRTLCICVMKNMTYSQRSKLDFRLVWCVRYSYSAHTAHITLDLKSSICSPYRIIYYSFFFGTCDI